MRSWLPAARQPFASGPATRSSGAVRRGVVALAAKKDKKGSKGSQKKAGGALADLLKKKDIAGGSGAAADDFDGFARPDQYKDPEVLMELLMITHSYRKHFKEYLVETEFNSLAEAVYRAPFVCLAHNKFEEGVSDPVFTYANRAALRLWEASWDELVGLPSRLSAEEEERQDRSTLLEQAASRGCISGYSGRRRSLKGTRFTIKDVRLFNVSEPSGEPWGQAVVFREYELEDGTLCTVEGDVPPQPLPPPPPTAQDVVAAEAAVQEQAEAVRALKEGKGLTNQDAEVQDAVAELLARKEELADVKQRLQEAAAAIGAAEAEGNSTAQ